MKAIIKPLMLLVLFLLLSAPSTMIASPASEPGAAIRQSLRPGREILREAYQRSQILAIGHAEHGNKFSLHTWLGDLLSNDEVGLDRNLRFIAIEASAHPVLVRALARLCLPDGSEQQLSRDEHLEVSANLLKGPEGWRWVREFLPFLRKINARRAAKQLYPIFVVPTDSVPSLNLTPSRQTFETLLDQKTCWVTQPRFREEKAAENFLRLLTRSDGSIDKNTKIIVAWHIIHLARGHRSFMGGDRRETTAWLERGLSRAPELAKRTQIVFFDQRSTNPAHNPNRGLNYEKLRLDPSARTGIGFIVPPGLSSQGLLRSDSMFLTFQKKKGDPFLPGRLALLFDAVIIGD
jgi:hypothetical protein